MLQEKLGQVNTRNVGHGRREEDTSPEKGIRAGPQRCRVADVEIALGKCALDVNTVKAAARLRQAS